MTRPRNLETRMANAFGEERVRRALQRMVSRGWAVKLTDEARAELVAECAAEARSVRKRNAASRARLEQGS